VGDAWAQQLRAGDDAVERSASLHATDEGCADDPMALRASFLSARGSRDSIIRCQSSGNPG